jgi:hypothetical protein
MAYYTSRSYNTRSFDQSGGALSTMAVSLLTALGFKTDVGGQPAVAAPAAASPEAFEAFVAPAAPVVSSSVENRNTANVDMGLVDSSAGETFGLNNAPADPLAAAAGMDNAGQPFVDPMASAIEETNNSPSELEMTPNRPADVPASNPPAAGVDAVGQPVVEPSATSVQFGGGVPNVDPSNEAYWKAQYLAVKQAYLNRKQQLAQTGGRRRY